MANEDNQNNKEQIESVKQASPIIQQLDKKFPELAQQAELQAREDEQRINALKDMIDVLTDAEKKRMELTGETQPNPEVLSMLDTLQGQLMTTIQGPSEEDLDLMSEEVPRTIDLGGGIQLTEDEIFEAMANPRTLEAMVSNLNETGNEVAAERLSQLVAESLQSDVLTNITQPPPVDQATTPPGQIEPVQDVRQVGQSTNPTQNIVNNIRNFIQKSGGPRTQAPAQVEAISSSLKSARNRRDLNA